MDEKYILHTVKNVDEKYVIHTVKNAMQLLQLFTDNSPEWSLTELAKEKSLNISHTQRLINTLTAYGYLEKHPISKKYRLGLAIVRLSGVLTTTMEIYKEARPVLLELLEKYNENIHIGILEETNVLYLDKLDSLFSTRLASHIGKRNPAYCTGCGKVLLAYKSAPRQQELLRKIHDNGFEQFGSKTVQTIEELKKDLDIIIKKGYSVSTDELSDGLTSIAAPILDFSESVIAAISITGPSNKVTTLNHINDLVTYSKIISEKLGYIKRSGR
ncbi:IclR family transcriptional regulator [Psychrobacillus insolitus]|uniref:IclR family transcriptional regulator n=1 Tax=Psychrobacillus insolitus TaxID=1461 RepID=A0A2W7P9B1_9BACI|nr:IclR family transcriptional regulator [Psychrobacillus insolitus]PZX02891.1 IclR family transcriptional regulator [Psychrobacillus insolitus]